MAKYSGYGLEKIIYNSLEDKIYDYNLKDYNKIYTKKYDLDDVSYKNLVSIFLADLLVALRGAL